VKLNSVASSIEGDMDLQGILGMDPEVRNGYSAVRVNFEIDVDADDETVAKLVEQSIKRSAVYDILTGNVPVEVTVT
jgi:uncharacterized OsmC-like protein